MRSHHTRFIFFTIRKTVSQRYCLHLETARATATTGALELASLGSDVGLDAVVGVGVVDAGAVAEVGKGRSGLGSAEEDGVGALGCAEGELVEGEALTAGGEDALAGGLGEAEGADGHLGDVAEHADVVGDLANDDGDLALLVGHVLGETVEANGGLVHLGHVQPLDNSRAELGVGTTLKELVKLDQKTGVRVLGLDHLGRALVPDAASASLQIDTHVFLVLNEIIDLSSVKGREKYEDDM